MKFSSKGKGGSYSRLSWGLSTLQDQLHNAIGLDGPTLKQEILDRGLLLGDLQGVFLGEFVEFLDIAP
jgi:hypothetical protein